MNTESPSHRVQTERNRSDFSERIRWKILLSSLWMFYLMHNDFMSVRIVGLSLKLDIQLNIGD